MKKPLKYFIITLLSSILVLVYCSKGMGSVSAQTDQDKKIQDLQQQIDKYQQEVDRLQSQASTLVGQLAQYDAQIKLTTLKIAETETKILMLSGRINQLESSLDTLSDAFVSRVVRTYKLSRLSQPYALLLTKDPSDTVSSFFYLKRIQESDRDLMVRLASAQSTYQDQKGDQEELQKKLNEQKQVLGVQKTAKAQLLQQTKYDEKKYQQLLKDAKSQLEALKRFVTTQGGASILHNQTKCDSWGCYYNQRDAEWGYLGLGGSSYSVAEYGCLTSSVAMLATHYGKNIKPIDIALRGSFVPRTGYLNHSFSVNGISVSISNAPKDRLDSELAAGRPVIAGLYSGPDHFIVILRKEGANYIMHDPFWENGSYKVLTEKYPVSSITSLRLVSFN